MVKRAKDWVPITKRDGQAWRLCVSNVFDLAGKELPKHLIEINKSRFSQTAGGLILPLTSEVTSWLMGLSHFFLHPVNF